MPDEVLRKIFQPFFTTKGEQGTGLGVPQVGAFMRSVGGHVCVASHLGEGTIFDLFFSSVEPNNAHTRPMDDQATPPSGGSRR
jgi:signal transduction histidine kinase